MFGIGFTELIILAILGTGVLIVIGVVVGILIGRSKKD